MRKMAAVVIVIIAAAFLAACGKKVIVGSKDEVRYEGTATKEEAEALGKALKDTGYFQDRGVSVILAKSGEGTIISFVVKDGFWDDQKNVDGFTILGRAIAPSVGGLPIKVRLVNQSVETKKEIPVS